MVSTRRSQNTQNDDEVQLESAKDSAQEPLVGKSKTKTQVMTTSGPSTRQSTRRTRSNSTVQQPVEHINDFQDTAVDDAEENQQADGGGEADASVVATRVNKGHEAVDDDHDNQSDREVEQAKASSLSVASLTVRSKDKPAKKKNKAMGNSKTSDAGNELTKLIPGYTAPMKLDTSLLDSHRPAGGLAALTKRAQETDASTAGFVIGGSSEQQASAAMRTKSNGCMPSTYASLYSSFKHGKKRAPDHSAGSNWFNMMPTPMTDELKTDLAVIRNRNYLDPKRFYKSADKHTGKTIQMGTVIEGSAEFYSSRLTKKQRRSNLTEEIMADPAAADYTRTKYKKMQQAKNEKARKYKKKGRKRVGRGY